MTMADCRHCGTRITGTDKAKLRASDKKGVRGKIEKRWVHLAIGPEVEGHEPAPLTDKLRRERRRERKRHGQ